MPYPKCHTILFLSLLFLFPGCSFFDLHVQQYPTVSSKNALEVPAGQGTFHFTELSLTSIENGNPKLKGKIQNKTGQDWKHLEFVVEVYDSEGTPLEGAGYYGRNFVIENFKMEETKKIGAGKASEGVTIFGFRNTPISKYDILLGSGTSHSTKNKLQKIDETEALKTKEKLPLERTIPLTTQEQKPGILQNFGTGNVNFFLGQKYLAPQDWKPVDVQVEIGIDVDFRLHQWPLSVVGSVFYATGEGKVAQPVSTKVFGKTVEWMFGGRYTFEYGPVHPFISGGLSFVHTEAAAQLFNDNTAHKATGFWLDGGILWEFKPSLHLGGVLKISSAEVKNQANGGGTHAGVLIGWQW